MEQACFLALDGTLASPSFLCSRILLLPNYYKLYCCTPIILWQRGDVDIYKYIFLIFQTTNQQYIDNNIILTFQYVFEKEDNYEVSFAFSYPYSYEKNLNLVRDLTAQYSNDPDIYFHKEVITYSPELRLIHLLTISSHEGKTDQLEDYMSEALFPERVYESRPFKYILPCLPLRFFFFFKCDEDLMRI